MSQPLIASNPLWLDVTSTMVQFPNSSITRISQYIIYHTASGSALLVIAINMHTSNKLVASHQSNLTKYDVKFRKCKLKQVTLGDTSSSSTREITDMSKMPSNEFRISRT